MQKIKVGVFGAGRGTTMINELANHHEAELVAVCDRARPLLDKVKEMATKKNISVALYEDFEEFFAHEMDAVVLANFANEHAPYAIRFLRSGRHVLSEVLPCETMAQAVELVEAVEQSGKVYAYAENYCYMRNTFEMRRRYEAGDIGEVQYAEGEYVHDCSSIWPQITYGDPSHWRNLKHATFYCTHGLGPILTITGLRPVQVVGFESNANLIRAYKNDMPIVYGIAGLELVTLENGAVVKSIHGYLKREPWGHNYQIYGKRGMMETDRWDCNNKMSAYIESGKLCHGDLTHYTPKMESAAIGTGHGGSDYFPTHYFIQKILGRPDGEKYSIDVYTALDMGISGILAYRSILAGNQPVRIPNLRNREERDAYRNDHACTNPAVAGDQLLPVLRGVEPLPDETYEYVRQLWKDGKNAE